MFDIKVVLETILKLFRVVGGWYRTDNKANSVQLELELGLSLAIIG